MSITQSNAFHLGDIYEWIILGCSIYFRNRIQGEYSEKNLEYLWKVQSFLEYCRNFSPIGHIERPTKMIGLSKIFQNFLNVLFWAEEVSWQRIVAQTCMQERKIQFIRPVDCEQSGKSLKNITNYWGKLLNADKIYNRIL